MGSLTVNGDGSLTVQSTRDYRMSGNAPTTIVNQTIDGIALNITAENWPGYMEARNNSTIFAAPEASSIGFALLGGATLLRRRRNR